ncbi:glycosyltransferase, partial [bacterium]|nr:glycosyltransferase [bacterium]
MANHSIVCALYGNCEMTKNLDDPGFEIIKLNKKNKFNPWIVFSLYKIIKRTKPDIVHTHLIHATLYGRTAAILAGVRIILTTEHNASNWQKKYFFIHLLYRLTAKTDQKIFAVSKYVKERMVEIGKMGESKIIVLYNGTQINDILDFDSTENTQIMKYSRPLIGTVGRLIPIKGHRFFIESAVEIIKYFHQANFLLLGGGELELCLKKQAIQLGIENHVHFLGFQRHILQYLRTMDVFVFPSLEGEGLPTVLFEAMAFNVPIVATSVRSVMEIIKHQESGMLVEPENTAQLAEAVVYLLQNPDQARRLQIQANKVVKKRFDIDL